ncbi:MAG: UDP-N-acetylglucosamine 1-carboxyvinyltransferase [Candidatus Parcubacteria bacterium]|nr:MAG: UDP-N-acetylglucosamine 1-carboxyvinyltransferase [Candidatus Parcubacteria bacterium]GIW67127.1 MAG: UDP-N-acetylglucosamine 1-carboxyvinyltransferase [Candidatus Parcubacteria bacterium]GIW67308.1 MAG: UDP-N-acetylglucosamine 1-carboxyvinyltransferase [Candidatus Parcubacteria bacterium]
MSRLIIKGGKKLEGKIRVSGSKNAILTLLPASLLIDGRVILKNVPQIKDVNVMIEILKHLGAEVQFVDSTLIIKTKNIGYRDLLIDEVKLLRASVLFLGPILAKFGKIKIYFPGGDIIGVRPIDAHLKGMIDLGAQIETSGDFLEGKFRQYTQNEIALKEVSVTASETLIMASALSKKPINLRLVALEPHVQALCQFLKLAGYEINGIGTHFLKINRGRKIKKEVIFDVPSDYIEAGTFMTLAPIVKNKIIIEKAPIENLDAVFVTAKEMNLNFEIKNKNIIIKQSKLKGTKIQTGLYPKFASDLQPPFGILATQAKGVSLIHEWMYENRFGYLREAEYMGANVEILDPHRAIVIGPTPLFGKEVRSLDIRAGISLVIAGLYAQGKTTIYEAEKIDRGYEKIEGKLTNLGAEIIRED